MNKQKIISDLKELVRLKKQADLPDFIIIESNPGLAPFFLVNSILLDEAETLEKVEELEKKKIPIIYEDVRSRTLEDDGFVYFPTVDDSIDYIRHKKGLEPLYNTDQPYKTISRDEWLKINGYEKRSKENIIF